LSKLRVYFHSNGFYRFNGKWKQRGLGKLGTKEIENIDTFERKGKLYYKFKVLRNTRLRSSMLQDSIGEVGKIKEFEREVDLNADKKRLWLDNLKTINHEKNESVPISLRFYEFLI
jgi:hypothetical protein